jgi:hypothetical protein
MAAADALDDDATMAGPPWDELAAVFDGTPAA